MTSKRKASPKRGAYTVNLGEERTGKVEEYRAKKLLNGTRIRTIDEAVCNLVDRGLELELTAQ